MRDAVMVALDLHFSGEALLRNRAKPQAEQAQAQSPANEVRISRTLTRATVHDVHP
ncbi:hypothetical protein D3C87_1351790 [compost metagenome]